MGLDMYLMAEREAKGLDASKFEFDEDGEVYISGWDFNPEKETELFKQALSAAGLENVYDVETPSGFLVKQGERILMRANSAYWRKANAIHKWFVDNCQNGVDEGVSEPVSREKLLELREICERVIKLSNVEVGQVANGYTMEMVDGKLVKNPCLEEGKVITNPEIAQEFLPTADGFFFGSTDYNEWYLQDLHSTIKQIDRVLQDAPEDTVFRYRASW
jgi:hypothetical protein